MPWSMGSQFEFVHLFRRMGGWVNGRYHNEDSKTQRGKRTDCLGHEENLHLLVISNYPKNTAVSMQLSVHSKRSTLTN